MKYSILTFNFNNYELFREPNEIDIECDYVYVTDNVDLLKIEKTNWRIIYDSDLEGKSPIYKSFYVRYHSRKYCNTDIVFILDASFIIKQSLRPIYDKFIESNVDICLSCNIYCTTAQGDIEWFTKFRNLSEHDNQRLHLLCLSYLPSVYKGHFESGFQIVDNSKEITRRFHRQIWITSLYLGENDTPLRVDEVVMSCVFYKYFQKLKVMPVCRQVIQSRYITYCFHNTDKPKRKLIDLKRCFFLNKRIKPILFR